MCHTLKLKCTKFDFGWGSTPDPAGGAYRALPDSLAGLKGPTSKGKEGKGRRERGREATWKAEWGSPTVFSLKLQWFGPPKNFGVEPPIHQERDLGRKRIFFACSGVFWRILSGILGMRHCDAL